MDSRRVRSILAAEHNLVNQRLLERMLQRRGHSVVMVSNGREAVEALMRQKFDIVLLDIQMPEMSGLEATAAIRTREQEEQQRSGVAAHIPIVAVTANAMKGDRERFLAAGMDFYIAKPVHPEELFEAVENLSIIQESAPEITFDGELFDGDLDFLAEIVNLFLETYPPLLSAIEDAISRDDATGLNRAAHTLKGSVANFGAKTVVEKAKALEMTGEERRLVVRRRRVACAAGCDGEICAGAEGRAGESDGKTGCDVKILIAEDDAISRRLLETILRKWGYEVVVAFDGVQAWAELQKEDAPRLAILDWMMPEMDGVEVCGKVRERLNSPVRLHPAAFGQEPARGSSEGDGIGRGRLHH